ncbi:MAG: DUF11 domain-containing protein, partial [Thermoplasmatales archaeon]|nr:DUF11 domain-containing protein [Thermoplasmatales archaeon]
DFSPDVYEEVDWENNNVTWHRIPILPPGETFTFYYNATAVDCGLRINNIYTQAYVVYFGEEKIPVFDSDDATVYVDCDPCEEADITVEKYVKWDCSTDFVKYVDAEIGDYVIFKLIVNNTGETPLDIVVVDEIPTGLSYGGNANPEPDVINENIITWYFNNVDPETSIVITFRADVDECGEQINLVNVTGTFENQIVYDEDTATVNVECPDIPDIEVVKKVKEISGDEYKDYITIDIEEIVTFRINVTNTGETMLDIIVTDTLPTGLTYDNSATPKEPDLIEGNVYFWYFYDVNPQETITITFRAIGADYGVHTNLVNVTGIIEGQEYVYDEDDATVEVICDEEWDKSSIQVTGECISPDAVFTITNTGEPGTGDMAGPSEYRVYRNDILEETNTFQLAGGESLIVTVLADCDTIRLEADQRPGHPGSSQPQKTIEDCGCVDSELEIGIEEAFFIGKLRAFVKNNKEIDISDVNWDITVKSTGLFKKINSITEDIIELLESDEKKTLKTEMIRGLGKVEVVFKATAPDMEPATITKIGFVIGRIIILFPPK